MKKTYAFQPLCLLIMIFDFILSISLWRIFSISFDMMSLMSSLSSLLNTFIIFMVGVLGTVVVTVLLYLYYFKKEKVQSLLWDSILHTVISVYFVLQLIELEDSFQSFTSDNTLLTIMGIVVFVSALLHLFVMLRLDRLVQVTILDAYLPTGKGETVEHHQTMQETKMNDVETSTQPVVHKEKIMTFLKSKNGKMILGIIIVAMMAFVGYKIWDTFFHKTVIDVFADMTVTFDGYDGEGEAYIQESNIDYDMTNDDLAEFVSLISFDIENNGELSNGDKVTIKASYSKETAQKLKVALKEETKEFDVSGLTVKYQNASQIDEDIYSKAYDEAIAQSQQTSYNETSKTFYKAYYIKENDEQISYQNNYLVFVFSEIYQDYDFTTNQNVEKTRYMYYYTIFDSSYNADYEYMGEARLYNDSLDYVDKEADVYKAIVNSSLADYGDSTVEEVNIIVS